MIQFVLERVENIVGKRENIGHQHFLLFLKHFQGPHPLSPVKLKIVW